jgi:hypothetical protein
MSAQTTGIGEILMRDELERVRDWAKGQIRIGSAAPASWEQYVTLIESTDAILHEMAVADGLAEWAPSPRSRTQHCNREYGRLH